MGEGGRVLPPCALGRYRKAVTLPCPRKPETSSTVRTGTTSVLAPVVPLGIVWISPELSGIPTGPEGASQGCARVGHHGGKEVATFSCGTFVVHFRHSLSTGHLPQPIRAVIQLCRIATFTRSPLNPMIPLGFRCGCECIGLLLRRIRSHVWIQSAVAAPAFG